MGATMDLEDSIIQELGLLDHDPEPAEIKKAEVSIPLTRCKPFCQIRKVCSDNYCSALDYRRNLWPAVDAVWLGHS